MSRISASRSRQPNMSIKLRDGNDYFKRSYSTQDLVEGRVLLHSHKDTIIDSISISFRGLCTSIVTDLQPWSREQPSNKTIHTFLVMQQPIEYHKLPPNRLMKAGLVHDIPFCFKIPACLLPEACEHGLDQKSPLSQAHRLLPPSMGTPESRGYENARVDYDVYACLKTKSTRDDSFRSIEKRIPVRVEPVLERALPLTVGETDPDYKLHAAANLCWRVIRPGLNDGRLHLHAAHPLPLSTSIETQFGRPSISPSTSTHVTTNFEFFPGQSLCRPPQLNSIKIGLHVFTYSAAVPFSESPRPSCHSEPTDRYNICSEVVDLGKHIVEDLVWEEYDAKLHEGTVGSSQHIDCSPRASKFPIYRASLVIPINLPGELERRKQLFLVPTFDSCLVARNYLLELTYSFKQSSSTPTSGSLNASDDCINPRASGDHSNVDVTGIASRPHTLSRARKLTLRVPLQIISGDDSSRHGHQPRSSRSDAARCPTRQYTSNDHTLPAQLDPNPPPYAAKIAQVCHLEDGRNESPPPPCYSAFRLQQNVARQ